jgi:hypothetical protein
MELNLLRHQSQQQRVGWLVKWTFYMKFHMPWSSIRTIKVLDDLNLKVLFDKFFVCFIYLACFIFCEVTNSLVYPPDILLTVYNDLRILQNETKIPEIYMIVPASNEYWQYIKK